MPLYDDAVALAAEHGIDSSWEVLEGPPGVVRAERLAPNGQVVSVAAGTARALLLGIQRKEDWLASEPAAAMPVTVATPSVGSTVVSTSPRRRRALDGERRTTTRRFLQRGSSGDRAGIERARNRDRAGIERARNGR